MTDAEALEFAIKRLSSEERQIATRLATMFTIGYEEKHREIVDAISRLELMLRREKGQKRMF